MDIILFCAFLVIGVGSFLFGMSYAKQILTDQFNAGLNAYCKFLYQEIGVDVISDVNKKWLQEINKESQLK